MALSWGLEMGKKQRTQRTAALPTPNSTQNATQNATQDTTQTSTQSFPIYEDDPEPSTESVDSSEKTTRRKKKQKQAWEREYEGLSKRSIKAARDYLVHPVGKDEFPEVLQVPTVPPEVLLGADFTLEDALSIWRSSIFKEDLLYIATQTNANTSRERRKQFLTQPIRKRRRPFKQVTTAEMGCYFGALFLLGTQGAAPLCDN